LLVIQFSVTIPLKEALLPFVDELSESAGIYRVYIYVCVYIYIYIYIHIYTYIYIS